MSPFQLANTYEPDELQIMEDNAASPKALQLPSGFLLLQSFLGGRVEPLRKVLRGARSVILLSPLLTLILA
jgi:hypothetical protein